MPVSPSGSLIQALSSLVQPAGGPEKAAKAQGAQGTSFKQHIDPVSAKLQGEDRQGERRQSNAGSPQNAAPAPVPGRGSLVNLVV